MTSMATAIPTSYLTSQGPNVLQALSAGPSQPTYRDLALKLGVSATRPSTGGDPLPSTAWHPEFQDVNNDGLDRPLRLEGQRRPAGRVREPRPVGPLPRPARRHLHPGAPRPPASSTTSAAGGRPGRPQPRRPARPRRGLLRRPGPRSGGTPASTGPGRVRRRWATGSASGLAQPGPNRDAIGAWIEVKVGDTTLRRELTVGGGHAGGELGWVHFGLGRRRRRGGPRPVAGRRPSGPWLRRRRRPVRDHRTRRDRRSDPWSPPEE